jgi:hypothetical protein
MVQAFLNNPGVEEQTNIERWICTRFRADHTPHTGRPRPAQVFQLLPGGATADQYRARNAPQATWLALRAGRLRVMLPSSRYGAFVALCCRRGGAPPIGWRADFGVAWFREKYRLSFGLNQT